MRTHAAASLTEEPQHDAALGAPAARDLEGGDRDRPEAAVLDGSRVWENDPHLVASGGQGFRERAGDVSRPAGLHQRNRFRGKD